MPVIFKATSLSEAPKDAVFISRTTAAEDVFDSIIDLGFWKAFPYRAGYAASSLFCGASSMFFINRMRRFFKVGKYGFITTALPACYAPMIGAYVAIRQAVAPPILLQEPACPVCIQTRSMAIQLGAGIIYPFAFAYFLTYHLATKLGTYQAPTIFQLHQPAARKEIIEVFKKATSRLWGPVMKFSIAHCVIATGYVSLQMYLIDGTMQAVEKKRQDTIQMLLEKEREKIYRGQKLTDLSSNSFFPS